MSDYGISSIVSDAVSDAYHATRDAKNASAVLFDAVAALSLAVDAAVLADGALARDAAPGVLADVAAAAAAVDAVLDAAVAGAAPGAGISGVAGGALAAVDVDVSAVFVADARAAARAARAFIT